MAEAVNEKTIQAGLQKLIVSEKPVFEAILQGLSPHQRLLLKALALEPPQKNLAGSYVQKHGLGSTGGVQHSTKHLEDLDLIERKGDPEQWQLVDPVLAMWNAEDQHTAKRIPRVQPPQEGKRAGPEIPVMAGL